MNFKETEKNDKTKDPVQEQDFEIEDGKITDDEPKDRREHKFEIDVEEITDEELQEYDENIFEIDFDRVMSRAIGKRPQGGYSSREALMADYIFEIDVDEIPYEEPQEQQHQKFYKIPVLKQIFDIEADNITEEELGRIIEPVLEMIRAGEFDKQEKEKEHDIIRLLPRLVAAVAIVAIMIVALGLGYMMQDSMIFIPDPPVPLAELFAVEHNRFSGLVTAEGAGVGGVILTLINTEDMSEVVSVTGSNGRYSFGVIDDGTYRLFVRVPSSPELPRNLNGGLWVTTDGVARLEQSGELEIMQEGAEIRICITR